MNPKNQEIVWDHGWKITFITILIIISSFCIGYDEGHIAGYEEGYNNTIIDQYNQGFEDGFNHYAELNQYGYNLEKNATVHISDNGYFGYIQFGEWFKLDLKKKYHCLKILILNVLIL